MKSCEPQREQKSFSRFGDDWYRDKHSPPSTDSAAVGTSAFVEKAAP
jgi:hypothetical protein